MPDAAISISRCAHSKAAPSVYARMDSAMLRPKAFAKLTGITRLRTLRFRLALKGEAMSARITINTTADGVFEMWLNKEGRDLLVKELQKLTEVHEHLHVAPRSTDVKVMMGDIEVCTTPYRKDDKVYEWGKIYLRTDEWDREHFAHVMEREA